MKTVHVVPSPPDLVEHTTRDGLISCPCNPRIDRYDGGQVIVHNAADGRP